MEIKAKLQKPITGGQRLDFIVEYNHIKGYTIEETETEIRALGYTQDELDQQEKERIARIALTKREVFLGLYQAKGVTPDMIRATITDPQALIEFDYANDYFRGNPLIDIVGASLGITSKQLDRFFETKDYTYLIPEPVVDNPEEVEEENQVITETEDDEV